MCLRLQRLPGRLLLPATQPLLPASQQPFASVDSHCDLACWLRLRACAACIAYNIAYKYTYGIAYNIAYKIAYLASCVPPLFLVVCAAISEEDLFDAVSDEEARASAALREAVGSGNADYGSKVRGACLLACVGSCWRCKCVSIGSSGDAA